MKTKERMFEFTLVNSGKHPDVDIQPSKTVTVIAMNENHARRKALWQNPCFTFPK